jgi:hypothetical protein
VRSVVGTNRRLPTNVCSLKSCKPAQNALK